MKRAVVYARVSTVRQAEDELPIHSQVDRCVEKAEALEATVDRVFKDEGISGTTDSRPAFRDAIDYCETFTPDYLIVWSTSRFARNRIDAGLYKMKLRRAGVELVYVSQPIDGSTDAGWMTESILELFDEFYSRQISADTLRSMIKNARDGFWNGGREPLGYRSVPALDNPKRKRLEIEPSEAWIVREVFALRLKDLGSSRIASNLNDRGILNRGKRWNRVSVASLLRNDSVRGMSVFGRKDRRSGGRLRPRDEWIIVPAHDPIIDEETWSMVQDVMNSEIAEVNSGSPHSTYFFTGILRCHDGSSMQIESAKGRNKRYWYYNCRSAQKGNGQPRRIQARDFDEWLAGIILQKILTPENLRGVLEDMNAACSSWARDHQRKMRDLQSSISTLQERNSKIFELFETLGKDTPNLGDVTKRLRSNNDKIKDLERRLEVFAKEQPPELTVTDQDISDLAESLRYIIKTNENPKKVRAFFRSFIREIRVADDSVEIEYHPEVLVQNREPIVVPSTANWLPEPALLGTRVLAVNLPQRFWKRAA